MDHIRNLKTNSRVLRVALVLGGLVSLLLASGAEHRWF